MDKHHIAKKLHEEGMSYSQVGKEMGVSKSTAQRWITTPVKKSWLTPVWQTIGGNNPGPVDAYGAIPEPLPGDLLSLYGDTAYSCSKWLSDTVSSIPLRVYVRTFKGQAKPKCAIRPTINKSAFNNLPSNTQVDEVLDHTFLDLLNHPSPEMSKSELLRQIDLDLSLAGDSFVRKIRADDGLPEALVSLAPDKMTQIFDTAGNFVGWQWTPHSTPIWIPKEDVIWFKFVDPRNRYGRGFSPLRGVYERVNLSKNELAYLASLYRNQARPDSCVAVKGISPDQGERLQKEWNMRFREGGQGGVVVIDSEDTEVKPLSWNPKDILGTELYKYNRLQIFNAYGLNPAIFDNESANRAIADTALYMSMKNGVLPRLRTIEDRLNHDLAHEFDERLFAMFDNPLPSDVSEQVALYTSASNYGAVTREDWRDLLELPEKEWAQEPTLPAGVLPLSEFQSQGGTNENLPNGTPLPSDETQTDVADTALNGAQVSSLLEIITNITTGVVSREAGKILIGLGFPGMSQQKINLLVDNLEIKPPQAAPAPVQDSVVEAPPKKKGLTRKYPSEKKLANALKGFFRRQEAHVLQHLHEEKAFINVADWNQALQRDVAPIMRAYYDASAANFVSQFGLSTDLFDLVSPKVDEALNAWTMRFCSSTNETTDSDIASAHSELKAQLHEGILDKESYQRGLTDRVKGIYTRASTERAFLIAKTESVRAINQSQLLCARAAEETGVKIRKSIILNNAACDQCTAIKSQFSGRYPIDTVFNAHDSYGDGNPPFHPSCFCTIKFEAL